MKPRGSLKTFISASQGAGLFWPTLFVLPALVVLFSLGTWQWQRKAWKEALLKQLHATQKAEPVVLSSLPLFKQSNDIRFRRVRLAGAFMHDFEMHLWSPSEEGVGWRIITPLKLETVANKVNVDMPTHVLVIRGNVDNAHKLYMARPESQLLQRQYLLGRIRFDSSNWATPEPDLKDNIWYGLNMSKMVEILAKRMPAAKIAPFFVEAEAATAPSPTPQPNLQQLTLRNRHFEYALTWWGLGLTLICVYAAFVASRLHKARP